MANQLLYKEMNGEHVISCIGHMTANICSGVRDILYACFEKKRVEEIRIVLSNCSYMDSTFIGLIVGLNKKLKALNGKRIKIIAPSAEVEKLLRSHGVLNLVEIDEKQIPLPSDMLDLSGETQASAEQVLESHEDLMEISEENRKKFELLHAMLKSKNHG